MNTIDRWVRCKRLKRILPGVYARPWDAEDLKVRISAAMLWKPDGVLVGTAAAWLGYWPTVKVDQIEIATRYGGLDQPGFRVQHRQIAADHVDTLGAARFTCPAVTALDLAGELGRGEPIDQALRTGTATLTSLKQVLQELPSRKGNRLRAFLLEDSRDEPWSEAERQLHRMLRAAGITGWMTNCETWARGRCYFLDIAWRELRIAVEVDGYQHHSGQLVFETDRARQNALQLEGWLVLRFTWTMITGEPQKVIGLIREAIQSRESTQRMRPAA